MVLKLIKLIKILANFFVLLTPNYVIIKACINGIFMHYFSFIIQAIDWKINNPCVSVTHSIPV